MTRKELINAINSNEDAWSCPEYYCDMPELEGNAGECCLKCAEKQLKDYEDEIRAAAIDECFKKIEQRLNDDTEISFDLPVEEVLGDDVDVNGFLMLAEEIVQKYKGLIFSKLKEAKHQLKEEKK